MKIVLSLFICLSLIITCCYSCTNFLITKGASSENSNIITYNADSGDLFGALYHFPEHHWPHGSMLKVFDWDSGEYNGEIPQVPHTYSVVGNMNEFQLSIGETTFGGLTELAHQPGAIIDYGSLIYITLQRAKTAREAISIMDQLVNTYGYASEGESFSIADKNEVWIMEMIGKGPGEKGAIWVALKIPDGYVCAHANQARIRTFPLNNTEECLYSKDVIDFAKKKGFYPKDGKPEDFSFSDVYNPMTFGGARFCEARVWSFFNKIAPDMDQYINYAMGYNLTNRMPLWIKPSNKISVNDSMNYMRDHYENTPLDFRYDVGAGAYEKPYRWRPLTWDYEGETYLNERAISVPQTGFTFVAQLSDKNVDMIDGILWFGVDDSAMTVRFPVFCGVKQIPSAYAEENSDLLKASFDSAFWIFNLVSNFVYDRYYIVYPEVREKIIEIQNRYFSEVPKVQKEALDAYHQSGKHHAQEIITKYTVNVGNDLAKEWFDFFKHIFAKYLDGYIKTPSKHPRPNLGSYDHSDAWKHRIINEEGKKYHVPSSISSTRLDEDRKLDLLSRR